MEIVLTVYAKMQIFYTVWRNVIEGETFYLCIILKKNEKLNIFMCKIYKQGKICVYLLKLVENLLEIT